MVPLNAEILKDVFQVDVLDVNVHITSCTPSVVHFSAQRQWPKPVRSLSIAEVVPCSEVKFRNFPSKQGSLVLTTFINMRGEKLNGDSFVEV